MPAANLERLERRLGSTISSEGVNINVRTGTALHTDIRKMLKRRHFVSSIKGMALL